MILSKHIGVVRAANSSILVDITDSMLEISVCEANLPDGVAPTITLFNDWDIDTLVCLIQTAQAEIQIDYEADRLVETQKLQQESLGPIHDPRSRAAWVYEEGTGQWEDEPDHEPLIKHEDEL